MKTSSFPSAWLSRTRLPEGSVSSESGSVRLSWIMVLYSRRIGRAAY